MVCKKKLSCFKKPITLLETELSFDSQQPQPTVNLNSSRETENSDLALG